LVGVGDVIPGSTDWSREHPRGPPVILAPLGAPPPLPPGV